MTGAIYHPANIGNPSPILQIRSKLQIGKFPQPRKFQNPRIKNPLLLVGDFPFQEKF